MQKPSRYILPPFLTALSLSFLFSIREKIEEYISNDVIGVFLKGVHEACDGSWIFNLLLTLFMVGSTLYLWKVIYRIKGNLTAIVICAFGIAYLYFDTCWHFPVSHCLFGLPFDSLIIILLIATVIFELIALAKFMWSEDKNFKDDKKGFCMDKVYVEGKNTGWTDYISTLHALMPKERLRQESLAIGISGNWGSGKTTFLNQMKEEMDGDYRILSFNPWTCTNKEQVISEFFSTLQSLFASNNGASKAIEKYRNVILDADIHPLVNRLMKVLPTRQDNTIEACKNVLEEEIADAELPPIAIFIDDLDRLEANELFEVLRLIRITANFKYLVFVVAYDRNYLCTTLTETKKVIRAEEYIQKIFHLEISLPKFEESSLVNTFFDEVTRILHLSEDNVKRLRKAFYMLFAKNGEGNFVTYIPNFRQARRFANMFSIDLKAFLDRSKDFYLPDFLGIEIVHFVFPDVYQQLVHTPYKLLKAGVEFHSSRTAYSYNGDDNESYASLLKKIFSYNSESELPGKEIRYLACYENYFFFRLPDDAVSYTDFVRTMHSDDYDEVRGRMNEWLGTSNTKFNSLYELFRSYKLTYNTEDRELYNYLLAFLLFTPRMSNTGIKQLIGKRFYFKPERCQRLKPEVKRILNDFLSTTTDLTMFNVILSNMIVAEPDENYEPEDPENVLYITELQELAAKSLQRYIELNGKPSIEQITTKGSFYNFVCAATYVCHLQENGPEFIDEYSNLLYDALLSLYKGGKYDAESFRKFIEPFVIKESDDPMVYQEDLNNKEEKIDKIFRSKPDYKQFITQCFASNEVTQKYLEKL